MPAVKITPSMRAERLIKMSLAAQGLNQKMLAKRLGENYTTVHGWDFEKAKQELKRIIENTDTIKDKDDVYIYFSDAFDVISKLAVRKNNC